MSSFNRFVHEALEEYDFMQRELEQKKMFLEEANKELSNVRAFYQTLYDLLGEAISDKQSYDFKARARNAMDRMENVLKIKES
jgi:hypothetical protein